MKLFPIWSILAGPVLVFTALPSLAQFDQINTEYSNVYWDYLRIQTDGDVYLERLRGEVQEAEAPFRRADSEYQNLNGQMMDLSARLSDLQARLQQIPGERSALVEELSQLKAQAVSDGLFSRIDQVTRQNLLKKIAEYEGQRTHLHGEIQKVENQIQAIYSSDEYTGHQSTVENGQAEIETLRSSQPALLSRLDELRLELARLEKLNTELESSILTYRAQIKEIVEVDMPTAIERKEKTEIRYLADKEVADELFARVTALETEISELEDDEQRTDRRRRRAIRDIRDLESELSSIENEVSALPGWYRRRSELDDDLIPQWEREVRSLQSQENQARQNLSQANQAVQSARSTLRARRGERDAASRVVQEKQATVDDIKQKIQRLENSVSRRPWLEQRLSNLNGKIAARESTIRDLEGKISNVRSRVSNLEGRVSQAQTRVSNLQSKVSQLEGRLSNLQGRLSQAQSDLAAAESAGDDQAAQRARNRISNIEGKISNVSSKLSEARGKLSNAQSNLSDFQGRLQQARGRLSNLQNRLSTAQAEKRDFESKKAEVERKLANIANQERRLGNLRSRLPGAERELASAQSELSSAQQRVRRARNVLQSRQSEQSAASSHLNQVQSELISAQRTLSDYEDELSSVRREVDRLERLQARGDEIESSDLPNARSRRRNAIARLRRIRADLDDRRSRLAIVAEEYNAAMVQLNQSEFDYSRAQEQVQFLSNRQSKLEQRLATATSQQESLQADLTASRTGVASAETELQNGEQRIETLLVQVRASEEALKQIHAQKIDPLNTQVSHLSGELANSERSSQRFQSVWNTMKANLQSSARLNAEESSVVEEREGVESQVADLNPRVQAALGERNRTSAAFEAAEQRYNSLQENIESLPERLRELEEQNYEQIRRMTSQR